MIRVVLAISFTLSPGHVFPNEIGDESVAGGGLVREVVSEFLVAPAPELAALPRPDEDKSGQPQAMQPLAEVTLLSEGFEGAFPGSWNVFDNNGATGGEVFWGDTSARAFAGSWSANPAEGGADAVDPAVVGYPEDMDAWMVYGPLDLSDASAATFSFQYWLESARGADYFKYVVSTDGTSFYGYQVSGDSAGWVADSMDLTSVPTLGDITGESNVWVGFIFSSDSTDDAGLPEGVYVDEVLVAKTTINTDPEIRISPLALYFDAAGDMGSAAMADGGADTMAATGADTSPRRIQMRRGEVDPATFPSPRMRPFTGTSTLGEGHVLLQFDRLPTRQARAQLAAQGIRLLSYVPDGAYWASIDRPVAAKALENIPGRVLWSWQVEPEYRISENMAGPVFPPHARSADGTLNIRVLIFEDVSRADAESVLGTVDSAEVTGWPGMHLASVRVSEDRLGDLASLDAVHWVEAEPPPYIENNTTAAARINADVLQASPWLLDGAGVTVGVWDGGAVQDHTDFDTRLTVQDPGAVSWHATHVAGTVGGSGAGAASAMGMAPAVGLHSYDWNSDSSEMRAATMVDISNHSYGTVTGWYWDGVKWVEYSDIWFGDYSSTSAEWDDIVFDNNLLIFKSAGNDRNDGPDCPSGPDCDGPYDSIPHGGIAKNIITVCATSDTDTMSSFSSWGPADDGRVKPDLCANGVGLYSTYPTDSYASSSGTSMSSPSAAGAAALLFQLFKAETGSEPAAHLLKALMIHGASDLGRVGPDYEHGWGLIDAAASADLIANGTYAEGSIGETAATQAYTLNIPAGTPELKATLVWTDPAGSPTAATALVNDLDLLLVSPGGTEYRPWVLNPASPGADATTGINTVDNVEQVIVNSPEEGAWTLRVTGTAVPLGPQAFAVVGGFLSGSGDAFTIYNEGGADLSVTSITPDAAAPWISWLPEAPFDVAPGASQRVTVSIDFAQAPGGESTRRLLVASNDADENPYPGGIDIVVTKPVCYGLALSHAGAGLDPVATPPNSPGCSAGEFQAGEVVGLAAGPDAGWAVASWTGTDDDASTAIDNQLTMPAAAHAVSVSYYELPCYDLSLSHTGSGADPAATPENSPGCTAGQYHAGEVIGLTASPATGWGVESWSGTDDDASTATSNEVTMPAASREAAVAYFELPPDDAYEENDDYPSAFDLSADERTWLSTLAGPGVGRDSDWYRISTGARTERLLVNLRFDDAGGNLDLYLYDSRGTGLLAASESGTDDEFIDYPSPRNGDYYLLVDAKETTGNEYDLWWDAATTGEPDPCFDLALTHTGSGSDPQANPAGSNGCDTGRYLAGDHIDLTAVPDSGWVVFGWAGTDDDSSSSTTNQLTMPAAAHEASVSYIEESVLLGRTRLVPIEPCRIADSRVVGGAFGEEATRDYRAWGDGLNSLQGGAFDCGVPQTATAVQLNFTAVNPEGFGYLRAWPYDSTEPQATLLVYDAGVSISNSVALPICNNCPSDFTVKLYGALTHLVIEVVGYYQPPAP